MARQLANHFRVAVASIPSNPSNKAKKGDKFWRCWRHASGFIRFFPLPASWKNFSGFFAEWDLASVFTTRMSWTLSVPLFHRSLIRRSPYYSMAYGGSAPPRSVEAIGPTGLAFGLFAAQPEKMRGSSNTCEGVKSLPARSVIPSQSSLWRSVTRPPIL